MRSLVFNTAALMSLAITANAAAQAAGPDTSHYMVIIATATSGGTPGIQMTTLSFPSEKACLAAATIFGQSTPGANVTARCAPQK
jgi:hypothetical protein